MENSSLFAARKQGFKSFMIVLRSRNLLHERTLSFLRDEIIEKRATKCLCNISFEITLPQITYLLNSLIKNIFSISIDFLNIFIRLIDEIDAAILLFISVTHFYIFNVITFC